MSATTCPLANYLPDELLLDVLALIQRWETRSRQATLARFCAVNRQWYDVGVRALYEEPYLSGRAYELFVRTICPSVLAHIKPTALSGLVKTLDLSHIVHHGNKSTTARLLNRTKPSLTTFVAPQASFAINCWASLSKCTRLRILDLSLVSECISFQSLNQTLRQLPDLRELYLPRCTSTYEAAAQSMNVRWPPKLQHLSLSGRVGGPFLWDLLRTPENFPSCFSSLSIAHSPGLNHSAVKSLLQSLAASLTRVELRDLPAVRQGTCNAVLDWLPNLTRLTVALDYIDTDFALMPPSFNPTRWREAKLLQHLILVSSGQPGDLARAFTAVDLYALIDERWLGRLRWVDVGRSTEWDSVNEGAEVAALEGLLVEEVDRESWEEGRWHYEGVGSGERERGVGWEKWVEGAVGKRMRARLRVLGNR